MLKVANDPVVMGADSSLLNDEKMRSRGEERVLGQPEI